MLKNEPVPLRFVLVTPLPCPSPTWIANQIGYSTPDIINSFSNPPGQQIKWDVVPPDTPNRTKVLCITK